MTAKSDLCSVSIVVVQQPAEPFVTLDLVIDTPDLRVWLNQTVAQALVVPFRMVVLEELVNGSAHRVG